MIKKSITIEDLAGMVKDGFDHNDKEFKGISGKFEEAKRDRAEIKQRLDAMDLRLGNYAFKIDLDELKEVVKKLEQKIVVLEKNKA